MAWLLLHTDLLKFRYNKNYSKSMRLSSIKLAGFKSFVETSKIPFPDQMTCVVGPNGCGKSNVIDAVRWVLGESSAKNLRGDAMADVIFNGSSSRKPISQASVELIFDNTVGKLPGTLVQRNQISIKRLVSRDGLSQYFLNGAKCRKRDITDIFLGTGLGPRSYAIIEQGMISRLIESKPQDLRIFLEEAAGVSKYKERRRETETRLNSTKDNLARLLDLRGELSSQLELLTEQAAKAKQYKSLKQTERDLKATLCVLKWQVQQKKLQTSAAKLAELDGQVIFLQKAHSGHDDVIASLKLKVEQNLMQLSSAQDDEYQIRNQLARFEQQKIHLTERKQQLIISQDKQQRILQQLLESNKDIDSKISLSQQDVDESEKQLKLQHQQFELAQARLDEHQIRQHDLEQQQLEQHAQQHTVAEQLAAEKQRLITFTAQLDNIKQRELSYKSRQAELQSGIDSLALDKLELQQQQIKTQLAKEKSDLERVTEALQLQLQNFELAQQALNKATQNRQQAELERDTLAGLLSTKYSNKGDFLSQLSVENPWQLAVENSLFGLRSAHVSQFDAATSELAQIWCLPQQSTITKASLASKIKSAEYPDYFNYIAVVSDSSQENVQQLFDGQSPFIMAVNQAGDLFGSNWVLPATFDKDSSLLVKREQLAQLKQRIPELINDHEKAQAAVAEQRDKIKQIEQQQQQYNSAIHQLAKRDASQQTHLNIALQQQKSLAEQYSKIQSEQDELVTQKQQLAAQIDPLEQQVEDASKQLDLIKRSASDLNHALQTAKLASYQVNQECELSKNQLHKNQLHLESSKNKLMLQRSEKQTSIEQNQQITATLDELAITLEEVIEPLTDIDQQLIDVHNALALQENKKSQYQLSLEQAKTELQNKELGLGNEQQKLQKLINQQQKLNLEQQSYLIKSEAALEPLAELNKSLKQVLDSLSDGLTLNSEIQKLTITSNEIEALGAINLAAIDEFDKASKRKAYLDQQYDDLTSALETLESAIIKIDKETKSRFKSTFDQVNNGLQELFPKVFGGGSAYLALTSDDLLDTGVAIMARPPGKKNSTIHLLSGGEKALTALSLVFSIFRLNPAPFCMLDEVDAPLDDANVGRFCRLVKEMSESVQFIYISHNKIAMEMAARLTGVTMAEPGVSRVVAVDIATALEMAEAG